MDKKQVIFWICDSSLDRETFGFKATVVLAKQKEDRLGVVNLLEFYL